MVIQWLMYLLEKGVEIRLAEIRKSVAHKMTMLFVVYKMNIFTFTSNSVMYKKLTSPGTYSYSASCEMELLFVTSSIYCTGKSKFQGHVIS